MKIVIAFETQVGTTQHVAEIIQKKLIELGHEVALHRLGRTGNNLQLENYDVLLIGSPTYYEGNLEPNMARFLSQFAPDLSHHKVAVFSLGDSNYAHFCGSAEILEDWVKQHSGKLLYPTLKIDGYPQDINPIQAWAAKVAEAL